MARQPVATRRHLPVPARHVRRIPTGSVHDQRHQEIVGTGSPPSVRASTEAQASCSRRVNTTRFDLGKAELTNMALPGTRAREHGALGVVEALPPVLLDEGDVRRAIRRRRVEAMWTSSADTVGSTSAGSARDSPVPPCPPGQRAARSAARTTRSAEDVVDAIRSSRSAFRRCSMTCFSTGSLRSQKPHRSRHRCASAGTPWQLRFLASNPCPEPGRARSSARIRRGEAWRPGPAPRDPRSSRPVQRAIDST